MPLVKCINGHTGCAAAERYLERGGRAIGHDFVNLDCGERLDGGIGWAAEMDGLRSLYENDKPYRGRPAITYRHYIVSPDPADKVDLEHLRELTFSWALKHFGEYQVAIVYHDDNENRIPHAHVVVNNTNVETGRRLHIPNPKGLNRDLQEMARERDMGYLTDKRITANPHVKGGEARTSQREFKGRAERRIEREGGYSWVADIRSRAQTARALAHDEASYRSVLGALGVELSLNSPNARRRDYLYALADHPSRKVGGEKLGRPYGKAELEQEWRWPNTLRSESFDEAVERAVLVRDLEELHELARVMETIKRSYIESIAEIDWMIEQLQQDPGGAEDVKAVERLKLARQFASEHGLLPVRPPRPALPSGGRSDSWSWSSSHSEPQHSSSSYEHSVSHSRGYSR